MSESTKKSASEIIQIDTIVSKTPKLHGNTNQETKKAAVQLNIVEVDENVTSEPCCAQNQTKYPNLFQILKWIGQIFQWIWKILMWIGYLILFLWALLGVISVFGSFLFFICVLFWGAWTSGSGFIWMVAFMMLAWSVVAVIGAVFVAIDKGAVPNYRCN